MGTIVLGAVLVGAVMLAFAGIGEAAEFNWKQAPGHGDPLFGPEGVVYGPLESPPAGVES